MKKLIRGLVCLAVLFPHGLLAASRVQPLRAPKTLRAAVRPLPLINPAIKPAAAVLEMLGEGPKERKGQRAMEAFALQKQVWDQNSASGGEDGAGNAGDVFVPNHQKHKEEERHAHAEPPVLDYLSGAFDKEEAEAFAAREFELGEGARRPGRELLGLLLTMEAAPLDPAPDPSREDLGRFGRSDTELREVLEAGAIPVRSYHEWLKEAFRRGLVYRLHDRFKGKTYYGIAQPVREALGLVPAVAESSGRRASKEAPSSLGASLIELAKETEGLSAKDEFFEFVAQAVKAGQEEGVVELKDVPAGFSKKARLLRFHTPTLSGALLSLAENSYGTPRSEKAEALCRQAVLEKRLEAQALEDLLASLKKS